MRRFTTPLIVAAFSVSIGIALAQPGNGEGVGQPRMFGKGHPFTVEDLPPGRTRSKLESLPEPARSRALEWLHSIEFPARDVDSIIIDDDGGVLYVDPPPPAPSENAENGV